MSNSARIYTLYDECHKDTLYMNLSQILDYINSDRSDEWSPYDETDWEEGLEQFTTLIVIG